MKFSKGILFLDIMLSEESLYVFYMTVDIDLLFESSLMPGSNLCNYQDYRTIFLQKDTWEAFMQVVHWILIFIFWMVVVADTRNLLGCIVLLESSIELENMRTNITCT